MYQFHCASGIDRTIITFRDGITHQKYRCRRLACIGTNGVRACVVMGFESIVAMRHPIEHSKLKFTVHNGFIGVTTTHSWFTSYEADCGWKGTFLCINVWIR
jgi:hypothetical protein